MRTRTTAMDACCGPGSFLVGNVDHALLGDFAAEGFWAIWHGESPLISDLFDREFGVEVVPRLLETGRIEVDRRERLRGIHGVTLEATPHEIRYAERHVHTWCALDAIGIPAALGIDAETTTKCPHCGRTLSARIVAGAPVGRAALRLWLPDACGTHLQNDFCRNVNLFCTMEHLKQHHPTGGRVITVDEAAELGRAIWADVLARRASDRRPGATRARRPG